MENIIKYGTPALFFEEALPLGNGSFGAMVYGGAEHEKFSLNLDTLWSGKPINYNYDGKYDVLLKARKLVDEGKIGEAQRLFDLEFSSRGTDSYLPLGDLYIDSDTGNVTDYYRELDIRNSVAKISFTSGISGKTERELFMSNPDDCLVFRQTSEKPAKISFRFDSRLMHRVSAFDNDLVLRGVCPISKRYGEVTAQYDYDDDDKVDDVWRYGPGTIEFCAKLRVETDGKVCAFRGILTVSDFTRLDFVLAAKDSFDSFDKDPVKPYYEPCNEVVEKALKKGFDSLKQTHVSDVTDLYDRVSLSLNGTPSDKFTNERLENPDKTNDIGMFELLFNFGRYLLIASSRKGTQATNLQGIWNEELYAPWRSNYTININTEMNYWSVLPCNMPECHSPVVDLVEKMSVTGEKVARECYRADGFVAHHNCDLWGHTHAVGNGLLGSTVWSIWPMGAVWLCRNVFDYYEYTEDIEWLRTKGYPLIKGAAQFVLSMLEPYGDKLIIPASTSPENSYKLNGNVYSLCKYTTANQSLAADLFQNCIKACEDLGTDDGFKAQLEEVLPKLDVFEFTADGRLKEWSEDFEDAEVCHRHVSHLVGLYPCNLITQSKRSEFLEACRKTLLVRGDESTGWSLAWKVNLWARLKDGNHAFDVLQLQLDYKDVRISNSGSGGTYANMFDAHPPFQIDGNFGVVAGIANMFLQNEDGLIKILPALPDAFASGSVEGLLAKGNITVDIRWQDKKCTSLVLSAKTEKTVSVEVNGELLSVELGSAPVKVI